MNDEMTDIHGYCIDKQMDQQVLMGPCMNFNYHGHVLTLKFTKLLSLDHFDEGESIDHPFTFRQNVKLTDYDFNGVNGSKRYNIIYSGNYHYKERIAIT